MDMTQWIGNSAAPVKLKWDYFMGALGNDRGYNRKGCQFFDGKRWKKCHPDANCNYGTFLPDFKYRRTP